MRHSCNLCSASRKPCSCDHADTPRRESYSFKEGLTMMAAKAVGIDPYLAAEAGENAKAALNALRNAAKTKNAKDRAGYLREAQNELRSINPAKHGKVVNAIQAKLLALQGRGGDTEIAHLTPGEVVVPRALQTPELMRLISEAAAARGVDLGRLSVGSARNSRNPRTGQREFIEEIEVTGIKGGTLVPQRDWGGLPIGFQFPGSGSIEQADTPVDADDLESIPIVDIPQGGFEKLANAPGFSWNGRYFTSPSGQKFRVIETITVTTPRVSSGRIDNNLIGKIIDRLNLWNEDNDSPQYSDQDFELATKQMEERLSGILNDVSSADNFGLQWAMQRLSDLIRGNDLILFKILGALHKGRVGMGASSQSALQPLVDYYRSQQALVKREIDKRVTEGGWGDLTIPES